MDTPTTSSSTPPPPQPAPAKEPGTAMLMGILAYLGILVLIPYFASKDPFVRFHVKQGAVLAIIEVVLWLIGGVVWTFGSLLALLVNLVQLVVFILSIIGIVNVVQNKEKELPITGGWGRSLNI